MFEFEGVVGGLDALWACNLMRICCPNTIDDSVSVVFIGCMELMVAYWSHSDDSLYVCLAMCLDLKVLVFDAL